MPNTAYFRQLLRAALAGNTLFEFLLVFPHSKNSTFLSYLGVFLLWISLKFAFYILLQKFPAFLKYALW